MSVVANVAINVDSRGAPAKLKQVADRSNQVEKAVRDMNGRLRDSRGRFVAAGNSANSASAGFAKLAGGALKLAAAYATLSAAQAAVRTGIQRIESERRIQFLAKQYGEVDQLARAAADASVRFGQSQTTANRAIADIYARLRPVGVSLEEIVSVYNGFNTAARISGSTAQESEAAFRQLSQALGSGALRGDEFNSIAEQVPGILTAISKTTGIAQGQLREYAAEGKITAEIVIAALQGIEKDGADQLTEALGGPAQAIKDFQNASEEVQVALTTAIVPQMAEAFRGLAELILNLEPAIKFIGKITADTLNQINSLIVAATSPGAASASRDIKAGLLPLNVQGTEELFRGTGPGGRGLAGMREESIRLAGLRKQDKKTVLLELMKNRLAAMETANLPAPSETTARPTIPMLKGGKNAKGKTKKPEKSLQQQVAELNAIKQIEQEISNARLAGNEILQAQLEAYKRQLEIKHQGLAPELEALELERNGIQLNEQLKQLENERLARLAKFVQGTVEQIQGQTEVVTQYKNQTRELELQAEKGKEFVDRLKEIKQLMDEGGLSFKEAFDLTEANSQAKELLDKTEPMKDLWEGMSSAVASTFNSALDAAVDGTENLGEALQGLAADLLKTIGKMLIMYGIAQALGALGGGSGNPQGVFSFLARGFGYRANGGPISPGGTYVVGENGPEVLQMNRDGSGQVINSNQLSSAMNRYRRSGTTAANDTTAMTQETQGGTAVLDKPIDVRYTVERINTVEYVTNEQFQTGLRQAAQQGAKQGEKLALSKLQNSSTTRRRLGI